MKYLRIYPVVCLVILGCSKSATNKDNERPVIIISSPLVNQNYNAGDTVKITGSIFDNNKISEVHFHISNKNTGQLLIDIHRNPNESSYPFFEMFQTVSNIQYKIQVIAKDNSANEGHITVEISSN